MNQDMSLQACPAIPRTEPVKDRKDLGVKLTQLARLQKIAAELPSTKKCVTCGYFIKKKCQGGCVGYKKRGEVEALARNLKQNLQILSR